MARAGAPFIARCEQNVCRRMCTPCSIPAVALGAAHRFDHAIAPAMETPMRIVYEISVIKDRRSIAEPQYETAEYYATTGFATTIDEAAKKATRYIIEYPDRHQGPEPGPGLHVVLAGRRSQDRENGRRAAHAGDDAHAKAHLRETLTGAVRSPADRHDTARVERE